MTCKRWLTSVSFLLPLSEVCYHALILSDFAMRMTLRPYRSFVPPHQPMRSYCDLLVSQRIGLREQLPISFHKDEWPDPENSFVYGAQCFRKGLELFDER